MKRSTIFLTFLIIAVVVTIKAADPFTTSRTNLTLSEIKSLPENITVEEVKERLRYFTPPAIAIPMLSFKIEGEERECIMTFDEETDILLYAWIGHEDGIWAEKSEVIWPPRFEGKQLSEMVLKLEEEKGVNQAAHTTPASAPR